MLNLRKVYSELSFTQGRVSVTLAQVHRNVRARAAGDCCLDSAMDASSTSRNVPRARNATYPIIIQAMLSEEHAPEAFSNLIASLPPAITSHMSVLTRPSNS